MRQPIVSSRSLASMRNLAARIVDHRERTGGFRFVSDLVEVLGVPAGLARDLEAHCIVEQYVRNVLTASEPPSAREDIISAIRYRPDLATSEKPTTQMKQLHRRRLLLRFAHELDFGRPWSGRGGGRLRRNIGAWR